MLEQHGLFVGPWHLVTEAPAKFPMLRRTIAIPATGQHLGFASANSVSPWWTWLARQKIQVFETEDAALLMSLIRSWGLARAWEVYDADERRVGAIFRDLLLDGYEGRLGMAQRSGRSQCGRFINPRGNELGAFEFHDGGCILTFGDALEGNPFARMILLGAVLSWA